MNPIDFICSHLRRLFIYLIVCNHIPDIVAKFHMKVAIEDTNTFACLALLKRQRRGILKDVEGGFTEYPGLRIVTRHYSHTDAQVTVTAEDVHGAAESRTLRPGDVDADQ